MSVDLLIFSAPAPLSAQDAARIYTQVCDGGESGLEPDGRIAEFHRDLLARFPALETYDEDDLGRPGEISQLVWSMTPVATATHVMTSILLSRADDAVPAVLALAARYRLACYDPQARVIHQFERRGRPGLRMRFCDGSGVDDPELRDIPGLLGRLSARNWFALLEGDDGSYVQVGIGQRAGQVPAGSYAVEYRDDPDDDDSHFRAVVTDVDDVVAVFRGYVAGEHRWKSALPWAPALIF